VRVAADKFTRALAWANRAEAGKIALVRGPWIDDLIEEACRFPQGKHDDQIVAVSLTVQMMTARKRRGWSFWCTTFVTSKNE
jgi:predicted phage terminase large subunit-like protein